MAPTESGTLTEFGLIQRYFSDIRFPASLLAVGTQRLRVNDLLLLGVGDDAAVVQLPDSLALAFSIDTQIAGVHFPPDAPPEQIAQRAFRCAVSDLAAMGATPFCFTLALTLPHADEQWLAGFSRGLQQVAQEFSCSLVGGDTTRGSALTITLQVQGLLPRGSALRRDGAQPGDLILVSGALGDSAAYVQLMQEGRLNDPALAHAIELFEHAYFFPTPRTVVGRAVLEHAHSAIDISDGLLADLGHLCSQSGVIVELHLDRLPQRPELAATFGRERALQLALAGGDDYELCLTVPEHRAIKMQSIAEDIEVALTVVGKVLAHRKAAPDAETITCYDKGERIDPNRFSQTGYRHF